MTGTTNKTTKSEDVKPEVQVFETFPSYVTTCTLCGDKKRMNLERKLFCPQGKNSKTCPILKQG